MKEKVNATAIVTSAVAVFVVAIVAVLGVKIKKNKDIVVPATENQNENTADYNTFPTDDYTYQYDYEQTTEESTFAPVTDYTVTEAESTTLPTTVPTTTQVINAITQIQETTTKVVTTIAETTTAAKTEQVTVPELNEEDLEKGKATMDTTTKDGKLPDDMYIAGLQRSGYNVTGLKGFIYNDDTADDCMQRRFGYNVLYDEGAKLIDFSIDTARIKFNYGDKAYMIQMWKGQYISGDIGTVGGEVGIYTRDKNATSAIGHYDCAAKEDWLMMEQTIFWDEFDNGEYLPQFTRKYAIHWWETGYVDGQLKDRNDSNTLRILQRITFKDETQAKAFEEAMIKAGFKSVSKFNPTVIDTVKRYGKDVIFLWQNVR